MKEIDSPDYRAMTPVERRAEYEDELEQQHKEDLAIELTANLRNKLAQLKLEYLVPHPQCTNQLVGIRDLLAEWIDDYLENPAALPLALIKASAGDTTSLNELLNGFSDWYEKELRL